MIKKQIAMNQLVCSVLLPLTTNVKLEFMVNEVENSIKRLISLILKPSTTGFSDTFLLHRGKSNTGQGMNSARRFASTCLEWIASMLITTISKFISSAISPIMAVGLLPSPSRSNSLNS